MKKNFVIGFICGGIICATVTGIAVEYAVTANPYPVLIDGETVDIEGYNINDKTYFQLRDVGDNIGFRVGFKDNTITVDTTIVTPEPTPLPTVKPDLAPLPELTIEKRNGIQYVNATDINDMLKNIGLDNFSIIGHNFYNNDDVLNPLLKDIPCFENNARLILLDYYTSTLVSFINSLR